MTKASFYNLMILAGCFLVIPFVSFGATAQDLQNQISNTNSQIQALDKEIAQYQDQIAQTSSQKNTLSNIIKELTLTRTKLLKEKDQTQTKINQANLVIKVLDSDITTKESHLIKSKASLAKMINALNQKDDITILEHILDTQNLADATKEYNSILSINEKVRGHIIDVNEEMTALTTSKDQKESEKKSLDTLKKTLTQKQTAIESTKKEKDNLLSETKNKESNYKKLLADRQKKRDEFEKSLEQYEAQLKFVLNPKLLPTEGKGVLAWPLDTVYITQLFGKTVAAKRLYTSGSHSGVDFRASIGTAVKSMGEGTVTGIGDTDQYCKGASFGKWVFIKYTNGLSSTFGHLSSISATTGQKVATGDIVALSGNTGHSTGPHLHVTVYASGGADVKTVPSLSCSGKTFIMPIASKSAYLDPMLYLPQIEKNKVKDDQQKD